MKVESALRSINRRLTDVYKMFGATSYEYNYLKNMVYTEFAAYDILIRTAEGKPVQLARGKKALEGFYALEDKPFELWQKMKEYGTAKELAEMYRDVLYLEEDEEKAPIENFIRDIQEISHVSYQKSYLDQDFYAELQWQLAELQGQEFLSDDDLQRLAELGDVQKAFKKGKGEMSRYDKWDYAERMMLKAQAKHEEYLSFLKANRTKHDLGSNWDMSEKR